MFKTLKTLLLIVVVGGSLFADDPEKPNPYDSRTTFTTIEESKARFPGMPDWWYEMNAKNEREKARHLAEGNIWERGATKLKLYERSGLGGEQEADAAWRFYEKQVRDFNAAVDADRETRTKGR